MGECTLRANTKGQFEKVLILLLHLHLHVMHVIVLLKQNKHFFKVLTSASIQIEDL